MKHELQQHPRGSPRSERSATSNSGCCPCALAAATAKSSTRPSAVVAGGRHRRPLCPRRPRRPSSRSGVRARAARPSRTAVTTRCRAVWWRGPAQARISQIEQRDRHTSFGTTAHHPACCKPQPARCGKSAYSQRAKNACVPCVVVIWWGLFRVARARYCASLSSSCITSGGAVVVCCLLLLASRGVMVWWLLVCNKAESSGEGRGITQIMRAGSKSRESRVQIARIWHEQKGKLERIPGGEIEQIKANRA